MHTNRVIELKLVNSEETAEIIRKSGWNLGGKRTKLIAWLLALCQFPIVYRRRAETTKMVCLHETGAKRGLGTDSGYRFKWG